jgi:hypothetical protein
VAGATTSSEPTASASGAGQPLQQVVRSLRTHRSSGNALSSSHAFEGVRHFMRPSTEVMTERWRQLVPAENEVPSRFIPPPGSKHSTWTVAPAKNGFDAPSILRVNLLWGAAEVLFSDIPRWPR